MKTIQEIAMENDIHSRRVTEWKKTLAEHIASVFEIGTQIWPDHELCLLRCGSAQTSSLLGQSDPCTIKTKIETHPQKNVELKSLTPVTTHEALPMTAYFNLQVI